MSPLVEKEVGKYFPRCFMERLARDGALAQADLRRTDDVAPLVNRLLDAVSGLLDPESSPGPIPRGAGARAADDDDAAERAHTVSLLVALFGDDAASAQAGRAHTEHPPRRLAPGRAVRPRAEMYCVCRSESLDFGEPRWSDRPEIPV